MVFLTCADAHICDDEARRHRLATVRLFFFFVRFKLEERTGHVFCLIILLISLKMYVSVLWRYISPCSLVMNAFKTNDDGAEEMDAPLAVWPS